MSPYHETVEWDGPGWYASRQEGVYENTHIHTFWVGNDTDAPDTYTLGLGTAFFVESESAMLGRNPDVKINKR